MNKKPHLEQSMTITKLICIKLISELFENDKKKEFINKYIEGYYHNFWGVIKEDSTENLGIFINNFS